MSNFQELKVGQHWQWRSHREDDPENYIIDELHPEKEYAREDITFRDLRDNKHFSYSAYYIEREQDQWTLLVQSESEETKDNAPEPKSRGTIEI